ncbi:MAG: hypothetical protein ACXWRT_02390, partial [Bdellovibrionota bacterium]
MLAEGVVGCAGVEPGEAVEAAPLLAGDVEFWAKFERFPVTGDAPPPTFSAGAAFAADCGTGVGAVACSPAGVLPPCGLEVSAWAAD